MAKYSSLNNNLVEENKNEVSESNEGEVPAIYPPQQLIAALRKIYGGISSDQLNELGDYDDEVGMTTSESNILPSIIQSIIEHPIFADNLPKNDYEANEGDKQIDDKMDLPSCNVNEDDETVNKLQQSFNRRLPIANLEAIIGKACNVDSTNEDGEFLLGILIAAMSVLTSCFTETSKISSNNSMHDGDTKSSVFDQDDFYPSLQVAGPLSLHTDNCTKVSTSLNKNEISLEPFSNFITDPVLMNYFMEASIICEERDEVIKENEGALSSELNISSKKDNGPEKDNTILQKEESGNNSENEITGKQNDQPETGDTDNIFQEPHSYEDEEVLDGDDNSSQEEDDDSCSSSSSEDEDENDDIEEQNDVIDQTNTGQQSLESEDNGVGEEERKNNDEDEGITSHHQDVIVDEEKSVDDADETESILLKQAVAMSLSKNVKDLPELPSYPEKNSLPEDVATLNPTSQSEFGKVPVPKIFVNLMCLALAKAEGQNISNVANSTILRLIIAMLNVISNTRNESINQLGDLIQAFKDYEVRDKIDEEEEEISEDDDPAFAASPQVASAYSSSESLEEKGLIRKAAAAAQSASIQRSKLQQDIEKALEIVKFYSISSYLTMKCLRLIVKQGLRDSSSLYPCIDYSVPMIARISLIASLKNFMSSSLSMQYHSIFTDSDHKDLVVASLQLPLLYEAARLWGESTPLLYTTLQDLENQFRHSLQLCFPSSFGDKELEIVLEHEIKIPWSETDSNLLKFDSLCLRLRSYEVIDCLVPSPRTCDGQSTGLEGHQFLASIYPLLAKLFYEVLPSCKSPRCENVKGLFLALHHRCNQNLLLWGASDSTYIDAGTLDIDRNSIALKRHTINNGNDEKVSLGQGKSFTFESSKCADSIALVSSEAGGFSAHQRASKVWGTVLGSKSFDPKSGVHRWAVRLDKCERGHVFVGVATSRASTKTYVGGDKYSWGVIGTQALWHERRKIRSDYGDTFRTGAVVIVTLDTNAGTLSFGILHDNKTDSSEESSSEPISILPSRQVGKEMNYCTSGFVEDWGIAFEGLPLDAKLYPAVGLYQRDDKVTLVDVITTSKAQCDSFSQNDIIPGSLFYPENTLSCPMDVTRNWNSAICNIGISFVSEVLNYAIKRLEKNVDCRLDERFFRVILPSVAASIALYPLSIPILSGRFAMIMLPLIRRCINLIESNINDSSKQLDPVSNLQNGNWIIRATPCSSSSAVKEEYEEYRIGIDYGQDDGTFFGSGIGTKGKSANCKVSIVGCFRGTAMQFVEDWSAEGDDFSSSLPASSCAVDARLNVYGTGFKGTYKNVFYGKCGSIVGVLDNNHIVQEDITDEKFQKDLVLCSTLLGTAVSHLCFVLSSGAPIIDVGPSLNDVDEGLKSKKEQLHRFISLSPILSTGFTSNFEESSINSSNFDHLISCFITEDSRIETITSSAIMYWKEQSLPSLIDRCKSNRLDEMELCLNKIHNLDNTFAPLCGGFGSLSILEPERYRKSREKIITALLHHTNLTTAFLNDEQRSEIQNIWRTALKIMEIGVRSSLFKLHQDCSRRECCIQFCENADAISEFLMNLIPQTIPSLCTMSSLEEIYSHISNEHELKYLVEIMKAKSRRHLLEFLGLSVIHSCLKEKLSTHAMIESIISSWTREVGQTSEMILQGNGDLSMQQLCTHHLEGYVNEQKCEILSSLSLHLINSIQTKEYTRGDYVGITLQSLSMMILQNLFYLTTKCSSVISGPLCSNFVQATLSTCKGEIGRQLKKREVNDASDSKSNTARILLNSMRRHTSFVTMSFSSALLHVILYLMHNGNIYIEDDVSTLCMAPLKILKCEIAETLDCIVQESIVGNELKIFSKACHECNSFILSLKEDSGLNNMLNEGKEPCVSTGVTHILENFGAFIHTQNRSCQKTLDSVILAYNSNERYLNILLDTLSSLIRSKRYPTLISEDSTWVQNLCNIIFGKGELNPVPLHFRLRILRLLRFMIPRSEPDNELVSDLLQNIGEKLCSFSSQNDIMDDPELLCYLEVKDMVSLLRSIYIHDFSNQAEKEKWLSCINASLLKDSPHRHSIVTGLQAFYGGVPDKVVVGSCVLLRPSAASNLAAVANQNLLKTSGGSTRSKNSFGSMAPIAACSGAEGVVAGLCRKEALAGRVSEINIVKGTCEIILFDRILHVNKDTMSDNLVNNISVRAVKVPIQDVVAADEMPLLIDKYHSQVAQTMTALLSESIDHTTYHIEQMDVSQHECKESHEEVQDEKIFDTILGLRSCAVLFSNSELLHEYVRDLTISQSSKHTLFSKLLSLGSFTSVKGNNAYINAACSESLNSLPEYQSRLWFLRGLLAEIGQRELALKDVSFEKLSGTFHKSEVKEVIPQTTTPDKSVAYINDSVNRPSRTESTQRQSSNRTDGSDFHSNSIETANDEEDENEDEEGSSSRLAEETEAAHLREAAIVQMAELVSYKMCFILNI